MDMLKNFFSLLYILHLLTDVLLLTDIFESFREMFIEFNAFYLAHICTAPVLQSQAALKLTDIELDLQTDMDMHLCIKGVILESISAIRRRFAKANVLKLEGYESKGRCRWDNVQLPASVNTELFVSILFLTL